MIFFEKDKGLQLYNLINISTEYIFILSDNFVSRSLEKNFR